MAAELLLVRILALITTEPALTVTSTSETGTLAVEAKDAAIWLRTVDVN